jgi:hypothetical protein
MIASECFNVKQRLFTSLSLPFLSLKCFPSKEGHQKGKPWKLREQRLIEEKIDFWDWSFTVEQQVDFVSHKSLEKFESKRLLWIYNSSPVFLSGKIVLFDTLIIVIDAVSPNGPSLFDPPDFMSWCHLPQDSRGAHLQVFLFRLHTLSVTHENLRQLLVPRKENDVAHNQKVI